jgi:carbon storage regulator
MWAKQVGQVGLWLLRVRWLVVFASQTTYDLVIACWHSARLSARTGIRRRVFGDFDFGRFRDLIMLVLSRKVGEKIWIGDKISVTVVRITGGGVRLGIDAPEELAVVREELKQKLESADCESESGR